MQVVCGLGVPDLGLKGLSWLDVVPAMVPNFVVAITTYELQKDIKIRHNSMD